MEKGNKKRRFVVRSCVIDWLTGYMIKPLSMYFIKE